MSQTRRFFCSTALIAAAVLLLTTVAQAATAVGQVTRIQAFAQAVSAGKASPLAVESAVHMNDVITTGVAARVEITFMDGTQIALGENARLQIDDFVFQLASTRSGIELVINGAFRFVTGKIGKVSRDGVRVRTPVAIIGIRGTDFFGGPIDGQYGVVLFEGAVSVTNPQGQTILDQPGEGTNVAGPGAAPGPVGVWPQDKVDRALAMVALQ